jgi:perosamine synthetase
LGARYDKRLVGKFGCMGILSFHPRKAVTTGEGGAIFTDEDALAKLCRMWRNHGQVFQDSRRAFCEAGFNYRMTNVQAALGLAQLEHIDRFVEMRRKNASLYNKQLKGVPGITLPKEMKWAKNVYWMYSIVIEDEFGMSRDELMAFLRQKGVDTRTFFIPMHVQPAFNNMGLFKGERYPVSEMRAGRGLYLPSGSGLTEEQINSVCEAVRQARKSQGK